MRSGAELEMDRTRLSRSMQLFKKKQVPRSMKLSGAERESMSVSVISNTGTSHSSGSNLGCNQPTAFLAVRKIPLQERTYITAAEVAHSWMLDGQATEVDAKLPAFQTGMAANIRPDPDAQLLKKQVQQLVLQDRDLHEKVRDRTN